MVDRPDYARGCVVEAFAVLGPVARISPTKHPQLNASTQSHVTHDFVPCNDSRQVEIIGTLPRASTGDIPRSRQRQHRSDEEPSTAQKVIELLKP